MRFDRERVPARVAVGLALVFFAVLVLLALFTPTPDPHDLSALFDHEQLAARGGYVGAGVAWVGLTLFGQVVSSVIMAGVILAGLAVVGFSLSKLIERVREKRAEREGEDVLDAPPFARVRRGQDLAAEGGDAALVKPAHPLADAAATKALPRTGERTTPSARLRASGGLRSGRSSRDGGAHGRLRAPAAFGRGAGAADAQTRPQACRRGCGEGEACRASAWQEGRRRGRPGRGAGDYVVPPLSMLAANVASPKDKATDSELQETAACLQETLESFSIFAQVVGWVAGPTVTLFKVDLPAGVRVNRITALEQDIALALAAPGVRIFAPIPGTNYVGIEVPNRTRQSVLLGDVLKDAPEGPLQIAIGKDVEGRCIISDLAKMPHLLIGGTTGSGKSVSINAMIMSILMRATPDEVRFIMIDPKRVEFTPYNGIPHLYVPVVTEAKEAASALSWGVAEMERRLKVFSKVGARNIAQYNAKVQAEKAAARAAEEAGEEPLQGSLGHELPLPRHHHRRAGRPHDERGQGGGVLHQPHRAGSRARPASTSSWPRSAPPRTWSRASSRRTSRTASRSTLPPASTAAWCWTRRAPSGSSVWAICCSASPSTPSPSAFRAATCPRTRSTPWCQGGRNRASRSTIRRILQTNLITLGASSPDGSGGGSTSDDPLVWEAADIVVSSGLGSTSNIQRRLKVGYSRAGRIMDLLEEKGVVGPPNGSKPREVLVDAMELETLKAFEAHDAAEGASLSEE